MVRRLGLRDGVRSIDTVAAGWHEWNARSYLEDPKPRKGTDADQPRRIACETLLHAWASTIATQDATPRSFLLEGATRPSFVGTVAPSARGSGPAAQRLGLHGRPGPWPRPAPDHQGAETRLERSSRTRGPLETSASGHLSEGRAPVGGSPSRPRCGRT